MKGFQDLLKQAQAMQGRLADVQAELDSLEVEGRAGGGMVVARVSAKGTLKGLTIDPGLLRPEEAQVVEDLIVAAVADGRAKAEAVAQERLATFAQGMGLPPGFKLPM